MTPDVRLVATAAWSLAGQVGPGLRAVAVHGNASRVGLRFVFVDEPDAAAIDGAGETSTELLAQLDETVDFDDDVIEVGTGLLDLREGEAWAFAVAGSVGDPPLPGPAPDTRQESVVHAAVVALLGRVTPGVRLVSVIHGDRPRLAVRLSAPAGSDDQRAVDEITRALAQAWAPGVAAPPLVSVREDADDEPFREGTTILARAGQTWQQLP